MSAERNVVVAGRQMIGTPALVPKADRSIAVRVRSLPHDRWVVERYAGPGDKWYPLLFTSNRERALEDAHLRRSRDLVVLVCAECGGAIGNDSYMTCVECGATGYPRPLPGASAAFQGARRRLDAYVVAVVVASLLAAGALMFLPILTETAR